MALVFDVYAQAKEIQFGRVVFKSNEHLNKSSCFLYSHNIFVMKIQERTFSRNHFAIFCLSFLTLRF